MTGFRTARLDVRNWAELLAVPAERHDLERALIGLLTPEVTQRLPLSMQFPGTYGSIGKWVSTQSDEADIFCVHTRDPAVLAGLIVLTQGQDRGGIATLHLGYLLGVPYWGQGYASELIAALLAALSSDPQKYILAGVDRDNHASSRVLQKAGFEIVPEKTTATRLMFEKHLS
ncbi:MAG: GNAT family N-acetyltransferase [Rhodobacteraceae bacterium]|nr:GNAT family N-acetyltransferase [Paracoccaceae bacterium]